MHTNNPLNFIYLKVSSQLTFLQLHCFHCLVCRLQFQCKVTGVFFQSLFLQSYLYGKDSRFLWPRVVRNTAPILLLYLDIGRTEQLHVLMMHNYLGNHILHPSLLLSRLLLKLIKMGSTSQKKLCKKYSLNIHKSDLRSREPKSYSSPQTIHIRYFYLEPM